MTVLDKSAEEGNMLFAWEEGKRESSAHLEVESTLQKKEKFAK